MRIMVREMSLIRGPGAPAKEMSFRHHLAMFKDHPCLLLPTISRHFPLFPAKKMSQSLVALQYGRRSRAPGRVPRAAQRQPGCTAEQTNHEPRHFLPRGASQREFRGFHETRNTNHGFLPASMPCSPLFTIVHHCSPLFAIVQQKNIVPASVSTPSAVLERPCGDDRMTPC